MNGPATTAPGPAPYAVSPMVDALVPNLLMLAFVLSGRLDLAGFTVALAIEAFLYVLVTPAFRDADDDGDWRVQGAKILTPVGIGLYAAQSTDWTAGTLLSIAGIVGTAVATLGLRVHRERRFFGLARQREYVARLGACLLSALMLAGAHTFVRLSDAGWTPSEASPSSWLGARLVQVGELASLTPEVTLTATMVVFFGFNEALWAAWAGSRPAATAAPGRHSR